MTKKTIFLNACQLTVTPQHETLMRWLCDEYCIAYNRRTRVLTVESFEGFDEDTGAEMSTVLSESLAVKVLEQYQPGWMGLDGFVKLLDYYGPYWTIRTTPI